MDRDSGRWRDVEDFCRAEYEGLVRTLTAYCGDRATAEDLAQETLARVWRHWDRVGSMDRPDLWSRRVAVNLANSWFRRRRLAHRLLSSTTEPDLSESSLEADQAFAQLVAGLTARQRAVLILRFYEDRTVAETATMLGVKEGTVRALSSQAVARLRRRSDEAREARP